MQDLIIYITRTLVDNPGQVSVIKSEGKFTDIYGLKVAPEDLGKIIGKQGRTAQAMRTILSAAVGKSKKKMVLEILE